mmetsp:Transcript_12256/g.25861  ORF Transcript_12256/g.25861 Transcript_12256/m.25861 type:complete len:328 (-) Transcript_12256:139-1122(-)
MDSGKDLLCLITGPSGSGKTSIALEVQKRLLADETKTKTKPETETETETSTMSAKSVVVIHQDRYFTKPFLPYKERTDDSYENSSGIDWDRLVADIESQLKTRTITSMRDDNKNSSDSNNDTGSNDTKTVTTTTATATATATKKIVIIEGHLLGVVAAILRQRFLGDKSKSGNANNDADDDNDEDVDDDDDDNDDIRVDADILAVLLVECSPETCKQRRLGRRKNRGEDETNQLAEYIDAYVWPSFLTHGVDAMENIKRELGVGNNSCSDSHLHSRSECATTTTPPQADDDSSAVSFLLEIDNSETASLDANVEMVSKKINEIILAG